MQEVAIDQLVYILRESKNNNNPPIFFLGAGASVTGNVPLAHQIVNDIIEEYKDYPSIKDLKNDEKTYFNVLGKFREDTRKTILKKYIENSKINLTHIYLANLFNNGYIDYILTDNFDNLIIRALALYNIFPPIYDISFLSDKSVKTFEKKSVVYLLGLYQNLWMINCLQESKNKNNLINILFHNIKDRPWIIIGYSATDPIFEFIKNLSIFNYGLYWVTYKDNNPNENVVNFLNTPGIGAYLIKGYDSDSFMLKLNTELKLGQPKILEKPFSTLKNVLKDIKVEKEYKVFNERMEITNKNIENAIDIFEKETVNNI